MDHRIKEPATGPEVIALAPGVPGGMARRLRGHAKVNPLAIAVFKETE